MTIDHHWGGGVIPIVAIGGRCDIGAVIPVVATGGRCDIVGVIPIVAIGGRCDHRSPLGGCHSYFGHWGAL